MYIIKTAWLLCTLSKKVVLCSCSQKYNYSILVSSGSRCIFYIQSFSKNLTYIQFTDALDLGKVLWNGRYTSNTFFVSVFKTLFFRQLCDIFQRFSQLFLYISFRNPYISDSSVTLSGCCSSGLCIEHLELPGSVSDTLRPQGKDPWKKIYFLFVHFDPFTFFF